MPIYEYQCQKCQSVFEEWQSGFEEREMECPECGEPSKRLISHSAFHLKGTGWYADGYGGKKSGSTPASTDDTAGSASDVGKSAKDESSGTEATPAPKKESTDTPSAGSAS